MKHKYNGNGYALAAVKNGNLIDYVYIRQLLENEPEVVDIDLINNPAIGAASKRLAQGGASVSFGMISCYVFVEL